MIRRTLLLAAVIAAPGLALEDRVHTIHEIASLTYDDIGAPHGDFGIAAAIDGDWIVVGYPGDSTFADKSGAAYVFRRDGAAWERHDRLGGIDLPGEDMGYCVAIDGDWIVIGAPSFPGEPTIGSVGLGRAYVYRRLDNGTPGSCRDDWWVPAAVLNPPPSHLCCNFGISVDVSGDVIVVGSKAGVFNTGRAYAFRWDGSEWQTGGTLRAADTEEGDRFGEAVATNGVSILLGARSDDTTGEFSGSAYMFQASDGTWSEQAKLVPSVGGAFGRSVATEGDIAIIGGIGRSYVFTSDAGYWAESVTLVPNQPETERQFGSSVAIQGSVAVVGDSHDSAEGAFTGAAYVFRRWSTGRGQQDRLMVSNAGHHLFFGNTVSLDERYAVVGSLGMAYVFAVGEREDLADYAAFQRCFGGVGIAAACKRFDLEPDGRVDLRDHPLFLQTLGGP